MQFRDLHVQAEVLIGDSGLPTVSNSFKSLLEVHCSSSKVCPAVLSHAGNTAFTSLWLGVFADTILFSQRLGKLVGCSGAKKTKMTILKGVSGALKPVSPIGGHHMRSFVPAEYLSKTSLHIVSQMHQHCHKASCPTSNHQVRHL